MALVIPSYGPSEVQSSVDPTVREADTAPLQNFGGGTAEAGLTDAVDQTAQKSNEFFLAQKKAADDSIGQDVYAKLTQKKNDLIFNPKDGAMTQKGQDALNVVDTYGTAYKKYADDLQSTLSNAEQRRQFDHFNRKVGDELNMTLQKHTYEESQNLQKQTADSAIKSAQDDAVLNYHDDGKVEDSITLQTNLITTNLQRQGMPQEVIDEQVRKATSTTYAGVIDRMIINGQDSEAKEYFNEVQGDLGKDDAISLSKSLESASMRGESQQQSDTIVKAASGLGDALEKARAIEDPKLRDETTARVKDYFANKELAQKSDDETRFNTASKILEKSKDLDQIPPQTMVNLSSAQKRSLEVRYTQLRDGIEPEANSVDKYNLQTMAATPELRQKFLGLNLEEYRHKVTSSELGELMSQQASLRKSDGNADPKLDGFRTKQQIINETLKPLGYDEKNDPDAYLAINREVETQMIALQAQTKKEATGADVQKIVDNIVVKTKDPNSGFFGMFNSGPAFRQDPNHVLSVDVNDIPAAEKAAIQKALTSRHMPVTDDKIVELYSRKINGMRQRGQ